jgi:predicted Zn-dependent protease
VSRRPEGESVPGALPSPQYDGSAFHPDLPEGRSGGHVEIGGDQVRFKGGGAEVRLPLAGIRIHVGGASSRLVFFSHASQPEVSIYTPDRSILADPGLLANPSAAVQIQLVNARKLRSLLITAGILGGILAGVALLFLIKDPIIESLARRVPPALEIRIGEASFSQIRLSSRIIVEPELVAGLEEIAAPLLSVAPQDRFPFSFYIADDPGINAFALPGGKVVVYSGLLLNAESAGEVAGVLAHEISHVTRQHSLRQLIGAVGLFGIVQSLFGDLSGVFAVLVEGGTQLAILRFSRDFEREADETGWTYLTGAGIDPRGLVSFFRKLVEERERHGAVATAEEYLDFLSTHPAPRERIRRLERMYVDLDPGVRFSEPPLDFAAFQEAVKLVSARTSLEGEERDADQD